MGLGKSPMHRIRLKGPWEYDWIAGERDPALPASGRVRMPAAWDDLFHKARGTVRFTRRFQRPTNLSSSERVFVVLEGVGGRMEVSLNGQSLQARLGHSGNPEFDVTDELQPSNRLAVELSFAGHHPTPGGLWGPVVLEIREETR